MSDGGAPDLTWYADQLLASGVRRVHVLAWRDLDDRDAGGSEVHADQFMRRWAAAGLDVVHRTSAAQGQPETDVRNGYRVIRRGSRYSVFPRTIAAEIVGTMGPYDALVEIWNGVPWFSPLWRRGPGITFLHHVHGPMWNQILPGPLAAFGRSLEARLAPPFYRRGLTVTPSDATRDELIELGFVPDHVVAVPNGTDPMFSPGGRKSPTPSVIAVGRLAPVKRFDLLIDECAKARRQIPTLELSIVGEGPEQTSLRAHAARIDGGQWVHFVGRVSHADLIDLYRTAWIVASASLAEGWGLSLTEAAACATPSVATDIRGHRSSVVDGVTGVLAPPDRLGAAIASALLDDGLRLRLGQAALERARTLTWDASALGIIRVLHRAATAINASGPK
jgi:glycosyltransferase involved in cell wall biosynthesis